MSSARVPLLAFLLRSIGAQVPILDGLAEELGQDFPEESRGAVQNALAQALDAAVEKEGLDLQDVVCVRDYSSQCPTGWVAANDGVTCLAPMSYQGPCERKMSFGRLAPFQKSQRAHECGTEFPCSDSLPQDFSGSCPEHWEEDLDHACIAPGDYDGPCIGRKSFTGFVAEEKAAWGRSCRVSWPAAKPLHDLSEQIKSEVRPAACRKEYSRLCPAGWITKGFTCWAPSSYEGYCGPSIRTSLTYQQKKAFEEACVAPWPCAEMY